MINGIIRVVDNKRKVTIPKIILEALHIEDGDQLEFSTNTKGEIIIKKENNK